MDQIVLIFHLWNARNKARRVAETEASNLLWDLNPQVLPGGPLSEKRGVFWISVPDKFLTEAVKRFPRLGYTQQIDMVSSMPEKELPVNLKDTVSKGELVRWRRQYWQLTRVYEANGQAIRESAPDRRVFMLRLSDGQIHPVQGYRGDGKALSRRGLPPYDARMLVNLVRPSTNAIFLDPFAGVGGILLEAIASEFHVLSSDYDPFLMHGLNHICAGHNVADAQYLPFASSTIGAIATEPPYDEKAEDIVNNSLTEMVRVLKTGSRLAIFCAAWQAAGLRRLSQSLSLVPYLDLPVNRKGTDCVVLAWEKIGES